MSREVKVRGKAKGPEEKYKEVDRTHRQEKVYNRLQMAEGCVTNGVEERTAQAQARTKQRKQLFADREGLMQELKDRGDA